MVKSARIEQMLSNIFDLHPRISENSFIVNRTSVVTLNSGLFLFQIVSFIAYLELSRDKQIFFISSTKLSSAVFVLSESWPYKIDKSLLS